MQTTDPHSLDNSSSYAIYNDTQGQIWVATMEGLNRYDRTDNRFERIGKVSSLTIDIDEDRYGNLWLSTQGSGLWKYDTRHKTFRQYLHDDNDPHSLGNYHSCP